MGFGHRLGASALLALSESVQAACNYLRLRNFTKELDFQLFNYPNEIQDPVG